MCVLSTWHRHRGQRHAAQRQAACILRLPLAWQHRRPADVVMLMLLCVHEGRAQQLLLMPHDARPRRDVTLLQHRVCVVPAVLGVRSSVWWWFWRCWRCWWWLSRFFVFHPCWFDLVTEAGLCRGWK